MKVGLAVTHKSGLIVRACSFPGNPHDGHALAGQLEQVRNLCQDTRVQPKTVVVDLGYPGVVHSNPGVEILHRGKINSLTLLQRRWVWRRHAIEPAIGHTMLGYRIAAGYLRHLDPPRSRRVVRRAQLRGPFRVRSGNPPAASDSGFTLMP